MAFPHSQTPTINLGTSLRRTSAFNAMRKWTRCVAQAMDTPDESDLLPALSRIIENWIDIDALSLKTPGDGNSATASVSACRKVSNSWVMDAAMPAPASCFDERSMEIELTGGNDRPVRIGLRRSGNKGPFTSEECENLTVLQPLLAVLLKTRTRANGAAASQEIAAKTDVEAKICELKKIFGVSDREGEVIKMIVAGHSNYSIGSHLTITVGTVKIHRKNAYRKLRICSQSELFSLIFAA